MWKGRPLNLLKCSKNIATKAAMSFAPSSVLLCSMLELHETHHLSEIETYHIFSMVCVRESNSDRLINEEDVCVLVPGVWVESNVVDVIHSAGTYSNRSILTRTGIIDNFVPSSINSPMDDEHPGPPFVQKITSSLSGSLLLSKK